jgi:hypothetical protein
MEKFDIKHLMDDWKAAEGHGTFIYTLHGPEGKQCNKYWANVTPDYAAGITEQDAEMIATMFKASPLLLSALIDLISVCEENPSVPGQWWSKGVPTNDQLNKAKAAIHQALNIQP